MTILFGFLGLVVGGMVNHLGSALPALAVSRSLRQVSPTGPTRPARRGWLSPHCPRCGRGRPWWQWLTLPAHLVRRTRCPSCGAAIGLRHPLIEVGMAVIYGYLWITLGPSVRLALYLLYTAILALILVTDIERRLILNSVTYPAILFALIAGFFTPGMKWWSALAGGVIGFVFFLGAAWFGNVVFGSGAMGGGDVKLAALVGLITGFPWAIEALLLTILIGAGISLILLITRVRGLHDYIPYGPFLIAGAMITLLWGQPIAEWFLFR
jgi:prepilin signal peptidase PulO-like enzyme (type II secretory pathway)